MAARLRRLQLIGTIAKCVAALVAALPLEVALRLAHHPLRGAIVGTR